MEILVTLVQLGGVGASLAFLYLGYTLLAGEAARPENPRVKIIETIRFFLAVSLVFFIVGVLAQIVLTNAGRIIVAYISSAFREGMIGLRVLNYEFYPNDGKVGFQLSQTGFDASNSIFSTEKDEYEVMVGVRKRSGQPPRSGSYELAYGPYPFESSTRRIIEVTEENKKALGRCIDISVFAIKKSDIASIPLSSSFSPEKYGSGVKALSSVYIGDSC